MLINNRVLQWTRTISSRIMSRRLTIVGVLSVCIGIGALAVSLTINLAGIIASKLRCSQHLFSHSYFQRSYKQLELYLSLSVSSLLGGKSVVTIMRARSQAEKKCWRPRIDLSMWEKYPDQITGRLCWESLPRLIINFQSRQLRWTPVQWWGECYQCQQLAPGSPWTSSVYSPCRRSLNTVQPFWWSSVQPRRGRGSV